MYNKRDFQVNYPSTKLEVIKKKEQRKKSEQTEPTSQQTEILISKEDLLESLDKNPISKEFTTRNSREIQNFMGTEPPQVPGVHYTGNAVAESKVKSKLV